MNVATKEPKKRAAKEDPPTPKLAPGTIVYWYLYGDTRKAPLPAMVIMDHGQQILTLQVFAADEIMSRSGIKHKDDVRLTKVAREKFGCWGERD